MSNSAQHPAERPMRTAPRPRPEPLRLIVSEHPEPRSPDSFDGPVWEQPWIDPELETRLFAKGADDPAQNTFLLLDAGLRARTWGIFDPEEVDVPCRCLFKGASAYDLRAVAPYLLDLTLPPEARDDAEQIPQFHKEFFSRDWASETGILIRTDQSMDQIWRHFRRFTKVTTSTGAVAYFRFWDPRLLLSFLQASTPDELGRFYPGADTSIWTITRSALFETTRLCSAAVAPA